MSGDDEQTVKSHQPPPCSDICVSDEWPEGSVVFVPALFWFEGEELKSVIEGRGFSVEVSPRDVYVEGVVVRRTAKQVTMQFAAMQNTQYRRGVTFMKVSTTLVLIIHWNALTFLCLRNGRELINRVPGVFLLFRKIGQIV